MPSPATAIAPPATPVLQQELTSLHKPIGVFDAGIGSFAVVQSIQQKYLAQDLIYFADRASFPYGSKTKDELKKSVLAAIACLANMGCCAVVLASNAPSVTVLDDIPDQCAVPVFGVYPPIEQALQQLAGAGSVVVMGVASMVKSEEIQRYIQSKADGKRVVAYNASAMVDLVESGYFLTHPDETQRQVNDFMAALKAQHPDARVCTLSSTHLPWLRRFFENAAPDIQFVDPADAMVHALKKSLPDLATNAPSKKGRLLCVATESDAYPITEFRHMLAILDIDLPVHLVPAH